MFSVYNLNAKKNIVLLNKHVVENVIPMLFSIILALWH